MRPKPEIGKKRHVGNDEGPDLAAHFQGEVGLQSLPGFRM